MILNKIGLAARARKIVSGEGQVIECIKTRTAKLVIISNDCKNNTLDKLTKKCEFYKIDYIVIPFDKYDLGNAIGKDIRVCVAITDEGFAKMTNKK